MHLYISIAETFCHCQCFFKWAALYITVWSQSSQLSINFASAFRLTSQNNSVQNITAELMVVTCEECRRLNRFSFPCIPCPKKSLWCVMQAGVAWRIQSFLDVKDVSFSLLAAFCPGHEERQFLVCLSEKRLEMPWSVLSWKSSEFKFACVEMVLSRTQIGGSSPWRINLLGDRAAGKQVIDEESKERTSKEQTSFSKARQQNFFTSVWKGCLVSVPARVERPPMRPSSSPAWRLCHWKPNGHDANFRLHSTKNI